MRPKDCSYRAPQKRDALPRWLLRATTSLPQNYKRAVRDDAYTCTAAGLDPFPVTEDTLAAAGAYLARQGGAAAAQRAGNWRVGLDQLDAESKARAGIAGPLTKPRGIRTLNAPAGSFAEIEADLAPVITEATRPRANRSDPHEPFWRAMGRSSSLGCS